MRFLFQLAGVGILAGTAVLAAKWLGRARPRGGGPAQLLYTAVAGDFPEDGAPEPDPVLDALNNAFVGQGPDEAPDASDAPCAGAGRAAQAEPALTRPDASDRPNRNPVDAPPAVPAADPTKIADPADFQDWDALGCQG